MTPRLRIGSVDTPLGPMWIATSDHGLRVVTVPGGTREDCLREATRRVPNAVTVDDGGGLVVAASSELTAYFAGELREFTVPLDLQGTPFQQRVWAAVCAVPYGTTATYRDIAAAIDAPRAVRAVGAANGANPAAIIVPCHRLIGADGGLRGYGGGLAQKRWLLELERRFSVGALTTYPKSPQARISDGDR